jgi:hypothetical protein
VLNIKVDRLAELTDPERSAAIDLLTRRTQSMKMPFRLDKFLAADPELQLSPHHQPELRYQLWCASVNAEPSYVLGTWTWGKMPYFSFINLRGFLNFPEARGQILNELFRHTLEYHHAHGRFTFYYATRLRPFQKQHLLEAGELAPVRGIPVFERYDFTVEAELAPGAAPLFEYQSTMLQFLEGELGFWFKRGSLKPEFLLPYWESLTVKPLRDAGEKQTQKDVGR